MAAGDAGGGSRYPAQSKQSDSLRHRIALPKCRGRNVPALEPVLDVSRRGASKLYKFTAQAQDSSNPPQTATQALAITVTAPFGSAAPVSITVRTGAATVAPGGATTVTGAVYDASGNAVPGVAVALTASGGALVPPSRQTGSAGSYGALFTAPGVFGAVTVTASVFGTSISASAKIDVAGQAPVVSGVHPASGSVSGGTAVTITGSGFTGATAVDFGTNPGRDVGVVSRSQITAVTPPGTATIDVTVTTPEGTSPVGAGDSFSYLLNAPSALQAQAAFTVAVDTAAGGQAGLAIAIPQIVDQSTGQVAIGEDVAGYQWMLTAADPAAVHFLDVYCPSAFSTCASPIRPSTGTVTIRATNTQGTAPEHVVVLVR